MVPGAHNPTFEVVNCPVANVPDLTFRCQPIYAMPSDGFPNHNLSSSQLSTTRVCRDESNRLLDVDGSKTGSFNLLEPCLRWSWNGLSSGSWQSP